MADVGYIRVSSADQNTARQLDGVQLDKVFTEKVSGANTDREQLHAMFDYVREGDTVHVHEISRLARSLIDLNTLVHD
ncbi:MAG: recombinase family protein, partial [Carnobacterium sp.]